MKCFYPHSHLNLKLFPLHHPFFCRVSEDLVDQTTTFYQIFSAFGLPTDKSLEHFLQEKWKLTVSPPSPPHSPPFLLWKSTVILVGGNIT